MAAKNEAKVRFSAETKGFNDGIKAANNQLSSLRAELKLNEAQMKANGVSVEALQAKQANLSAQMEAAEDKAKNLSDKLAVAVEVFGENSEEATKLRNQLLAVQTQQVKLQSAIDSCTAEMERQEEAASRVKTESEKLSDEMSEQKSELDKLKKAYVDAVLEFGTASDEAQELAGRIDDLSGDLADNRRRMDDAERAADELDRSLQDVGDGADGAGDGFSVFKGALADLVSEGIQFAIGKMSELFSYFRDLPAATAEFRQDLSTLVTSFDNVGMSTETATDTWKELYKIFGEDDRAVETANHIARLSDNQKDLTDWVTISTGIYGRFQDSLDPAALAESAVETRNVGTVTGALADALNWSSEAAVMFADYMSEDVTTAEDAFNVALSECTTEQERQALITDTLTKLYGGAAETYRETSGAQMDAKEATAETALAEANLAKSIEPATTAWTNMKNTLLTGVAPAIETIAGGITKLFTFLNEHPAVMWAIIGVIGVITAAMVVLTIATTAQAIANSALVASMAPMILPILAIVAAIAAVVAIVVICIKHWDEIKAAAGVAWDWIAEKWKAAGEWFNTKVVQPISNFFKNLWSGVSNAASNAWNGLKNGAQNAWNGVKSIFSSVASFFRDIFGKAWEGVKAVFSTGGKIFSGITEGITSAFKKVVNAIIGGINRVVSIPFNSINSVLSKIRNAKFLGIQPFSGLGSISVPQIPLLAEGGILTQPTLNIAGEAGPEAIIPIDKLQSYIGAAVDRTYQALNMQALVAAVEDLANRPIELSVNGKQFAVATATDRDNVDGNRLALARRGLAL